MTQPGGDDEVTLVTMAFEAADPERLLAVLSRYVVLTRMHTACRNVDLCQSVTEPRRFIVVEKWMGADDQRAHLDAPETVAMAEACRGLLTGPPVLDLLAGLNAHDLA